MQSEVRKVLDSYNFFEIPLWLTRIDAAERADAAKREEPATVSDVVAVDCVRCGMHIYTTDHAVRCNCGTAIVVHRHDRKVDTAGRDALRKEVTELVDEWRKWALIRPTIEAECVLEFCNELNNIITTKPDTVENQSATASGPVQREKLSFSVECKRCGQFTCVSEEYAAVCGCGAVFKLHRHNHQGNTGETKSNDSVQDIRKATLPELVTKAQEADQWLEIKPVIEPAVAEKMYEIATRAVRDAMPDVLDGLAETHNERGWYGMADWIKRYAAKLRKECGA